MNIMSHNHLLFMYRANSSTGVPQQPDGGELEDCAIIQLESQFSMNQWHDISCSATDVKQYICKSDGTDGNSKYCMDLFMVITHIVLD